MRLGHRDNEGSLSGSPFQWRPLARESRPGRLNESAQPGCLVVCRELVAQIQKWPVTENSPRGSANVQFFS